MRNVTNQVGEKHVQLSKNWNEFDYKADVRVLHMLTDGFPGLLTKFP